MIVKYRGHTIDIHRAKSMGGDTLLYFSIFRDEDGFECSSGFSYSGDTVRDHIKWSKRDIDDELLRADPWDEKANKNYQAIYHTPES